jgi:hypothetical protein
LLGGSLYGSVSDDIDGVSIVKTVQLWSFVQERQVPVCPYPRLTVAEIVFGFGQPRVFEVGDTVVKSAMVSRGV